MALTGFFKGLQAGVNLYNTVEDNSIKQAKERLGLLQAEDDYANQQAIRGDVLRSKLSGLQYNTMKDNANMDSLLQTHDGKVAVVNAINKFTKAQADNNYDGELLYGKNRNNATNFKHLFTGEQYKNQYEGEKQYGGLRNDTKYAELLAKKQGSHNLYDTRKTDDTAYHALENTVLDTAKAKILGGNENAQKNLNNAKANNIKSGLKYEVTDNRKDDLRGILNNAVTTGVINAQTGVTNANKRAINAQTNLKIAGDKGVVYDGVRHLNNLAKIVTTNNDNATQTLNSQLNLEHKTPQQQVQALSKFIKQNPKSPLVSRASSLLITANQDLKDDTSTKMLQLGATKQAIATQYQLKELGNGMNEVMINDTPVKLTDEQLVELGAKTMPNKVMAEGMKIAKEYQQKLALKQAEQQWTIAKLNEQDRQTRFIKANDAYMQWLKDNPTDDEELKKKKRLEFMGYYNLLDNQQQGGGSTTTEQRQFPSKEQISFDHNLKKVANELQQIGYIKIIGGQVYSNDGTPLTADDIKNIQAKRQEYFNKLGK